MRTRLRIRPDDILPTAGGILRQQGVDNPERADAIVVDIADRARAELAKVIVPDGLLAVVDPADFAPIHHGGGRNDAETPLADIVPRAVATALFVVTTGQAVSDRVATLFDARDYALATALDAAASLAADAAAAFAEDAFGELPEAEGLAVGRYSPGYCGWHVSGQKALLASVGAEEIGITLSGNWLMRPLKSVSGAIFAGTPEMHVFDADYPCCAVCRDRSCLERMKRFRKD